MASPRRSARLIALGLSFPAKTLERLRWLFLAVSLLALATSVPLALISPTAAWLHAGGLAGAAWLAGWWVTGYRRGRFPLAGELITIAALVALGVSVGNPEYVLGVIYCAALFRALYGAGPRRGWWWLNSSAPTSSRSG